VFTPSIYQIAVQKPDVIEMLVHDDGVIAPELERTYKNRVTHDPHDLDRARELASTTDKVRLGVFFRDETRARYDLIRQVQARSVDERVALLNKELDKYAV
jgi:2-oxoglutarate ferredoxin oxidoreductase subunit beta